MPFSPGRDAGTGECRYWRVVHENASNLSGIPDEGPYGRCGWADGRLIISLRGGRRGVRILERLAAGNAVGSLNSGFICYRFNGYVNEYASPFE